ncbi:MAG TPA: hypothetical protein VG936_11505 [Lacunisphaera sp.]|nr:hypothetical protein [Lacunisphaera sp.]
MSCTLRSFVSSHLIRNAGIGWRRIALGATLAVAAAGSESPGPANQPVNYEAFGAAGDGVTDDLPAIVRAHAFANAHGLPVKTKPGATYHLGRRALTAIIATDTDWGTSRFIIDDTDVENHRASLFSVQSLLAPVQLTIPRLTRDQRHLDVHPPRDCWVRVENSRRKRYIREGLNQNNGSAQRDCFILRRDGSIEGDIDWDYDEVTQVEARPIDERPLVLRGGIFTTTANRMKQAQGYNYWSRNIAITRSNTTVTGLVHHVVGEGEFGHPYNGFLSAHGCANVTFRDCFVTGHKTYSTIGAAGKPVSMGSYDLIANEVVNFTMTGVRMDSIGDTTRWGVIGTNFCKNILLEHCTLSRMDTHQGVSGTYTLRDCTIGYVGLNAIGRGLLSVEDSTFTSRALISLRADYGSTWEGTVVIRNCRWVPLGGTKSAPHLLNASNSGRHDFGYPCFMPREIVIDGLVIDDHQHPQDDQGPYLFNDPDGPAPATATRPFPYHLTEQVTIRHLTTTSGRKIRISPDAAFAARVKVMEQD